MAIGVVRGIRVVIHSTAAAASSRHCVLSHPDVFGPNLEGERIHPDASIPRQKWR